MANSEHVKLVKKGAKAFNAWRERNPRTIIDLYEASLREIDLSGASLSRATLRGADLSGANLEGADLTVAYLALSDLTGANLANAKIINANLWSAILENANLAKANLTAAYLAEAVCQNTIFEDAKLWSANLRNMHLQGANFTNAEVAWTVFADIDLRGAIGLETIKHLFPSTIGLDTILRSEGDIPLAFLKGCGLPDHVIDFVVSIARKPIQYYKSFISYGEPDKDLANYLREKLEGAGVRCWLFSESARTGESLWGEINKEIRLHEKLIVICSRGSLQRSGVQKEINEGLQFEKEEKLRHLKDEELVANGTLDLSEFAKRKYHTQVLFPITIDNYIYDEWVSPFKAELTNRVIGDFRNWEDFKTFDKAFQKLLKDLNSSD